jgi:hypothetical protein
LIKVGPLNHASKFFYTKSNLITAFLSISLFTIYLLLFLTNKAKAFEVVNSSTKSLGTTIGFGKDEIIAFFMERSDQMINSYITFNQIWDSLFALIYAIMYVILLSIVYKPYLIKAKLINLLPFTQLLFDWLENLSLATLSRQFLADETISTSTSLFASTTSSIKWMVSILVYALLLVGTIMRLKGLLKRSRI